MSSDERRAAKAEMDAAKARAKAMRPWYKKKRIIIPLVLVVLLILIVAVSGGDTDGGGEGGGDGGNGEDVVQAQIPGEATLEVTGESATTRITGVTFRDESLPGNEFTRAPEGRTFMVFDTEIQNVGDEDLDLNSSVYRLELPSGEIVDYGMALGGDNELGPGLGTTLTPGAMKAGTLTWEVPVPSAGQEYVLLWKPNPFDDKQAQFTYVHQ